MSAAPGRPKQARTAAEGEATPVTAEGWEPHWLQDHAGRITEPQAWRGVESQYASSTTLLVDSLDEHDALERLLEGSKPPLQEAADPRKHFLLVTPFRYTPLHDSRFRQAGQGRHGLWYGARQLQGACAEVAYWRMRFMQDSAGLASSKIITKHTFFAAEVAGNGIDLMAPPWNAFEAAWKHSGDYAETHRLSAAAQAAGIQVIRYESARAPGCACVAVFTPDALGEPRKGLDASRQQWTCTATREHVMMARDGGAGRYEWPG